MPTGTLATLIFYYAGHGISKDGEFYFIPSDADPRDKHIWISLNELQRYIPEKVKVIWLIEACYSRSFVKGKSLKDLGVERINEKALKIP